MDYSIQRCRRPKLPGTMIASPNLVLVARFCELDPEIQHYLKSRLTTAGYSTLSVPNTSDLHIPIEPAVRPQIQRLIGQLLYERKAVPDNTGDKRHRAAQRQQRSYLEPINFEEVLKQAHSLARLLDQKTDEIAMALDCYATYDVVLNEIQRSTDLLNNLDQNRQFFQRKVNRVTTFLPLNQLLYALFCFGVVPAFMAHDVAVRPPTNAQGAYRRLAAVLKLDQHLPNLRISFAEKEQFVRERGSGSGTDVVIFTGTPKNGEIIWRKLQPPLFILNGAGQNPIVVTETANLEGAVHSTLRVALQNQGQDCAAPNAILVHTAVLEEFKRRLVEQLRQLEPQVGPYSDRHNIVGPNTDPEQVVKVARLLTDNRGAYVYGGTINPCTGLIYPTVLCKPLDQGPNFTEWFAPIIMIHPYHRDNELSRYFENPQYRPHAMYVTVFGVSAYVESLIKKGLHDHANILYDTDLHYEERGFLPYGGLGPAASCIYVEGRRIPGATLPQRDIYLYLVQPALLREKQRGTGSHSTGRSTMTI